jgi:hypothetical protein
MNGTHLLTACALATFSYARAALAQPPVVVHGNTNCPSAEAVRASMQTLRPDGEWPNQAIVVDVGDRISLTLGDEPDTRREFPADPDCAVRADTVATVVATWAGEITPVPTDAPLLTVTRNAPAPAPQVKSRHVVELDAGTFYSPMWGHAAGAWLGVGRTPRDGGFGARVLGAYQAARDVTLDAGNNQVLRILVGAAVTYHLQRKYVFASGDLGLIGSFTRAQGSGYEINDAASVTNFGGIFDLRGGVRLGRARVWLNARALRLAHAESVKVRSTSPGVGDSASFNRWDAQFGAGVGFRFE